MAKKRLKDLIEGKIKEKMGRFGSIISAEKVRSMTRLVENRHEPYSEGDKVRIRSTGNIGTIVVVGRDGNYAVELENHGVKMYHQYNLDMAEAA